MAFNEISAAIAQRLPAKCLMVRWQIIEYQSCPCCVESRQLTVLPSMGADNTAYGKQTVKQDSHSMKQAS